MNWRKIFNNKYVLKFIQYYNIIMLIVYTFGCYIYLFNIDIYIVLYKILAAVFGFNLSSQIFVGYLLSRLNFCRWQLLAFLFNIIINILGIFFTFVKIKSDLIIMTVISTIFIAYIILYIIFKKKTQIKQN